MFHSKKKTSSLIELLKSKPQPKHAKLKKGLIGLSVVGGILSIFSKKTKP